MKHEARRDAPRSAPQDRSEPLQIGSWMLDPSTGTLSGPDGTARLRPREVKLLLYLARRAGDVVTTEDILENVWCDVVVANDAVYFAISQLRKALGDDAQHPAVLETLPKRGYRLIAPVATAAPSGPAAVSVDAPAAPATAAPPAIAVPEGSPRTSRMGPVTAIAVTLSLLLGVVLMISWPDGTAPDASPPDNAIAVLPFTDLSAAGDQGYLAAGLSEELIQRLSRLDGLIVAARTSAFAFEGSDLGVTGIGRELGVASILEGSVRRDGNRVRVAVQLIDAATGFERWSNSYDRELSSVLRLQDDISQAILAALAPQLAGTDAVPGPVRAVDPVAYDHYLQGLAGLRVFSYESLQQARESFDHALKLDPGFADAWAEQAHGLLMAHSTGLQPGQDTLREAMAMAQRALDLDADNVRALTVMGAALAGVEGSEAGEPWFRQARNLAPRDPEALLGAANCVVAGTDPRAARPLLDEALRVDPFNPQVAQSFGHYERWQGNLRNAERTLLRAAGQNPRNPNLRALAGVLLLRDRGDYVSGLDHLQQAAVLDPRDHEIAAFLSLAYSSLGIAERAIHWLERGLEQGPHSGLVQAARMSHLLASGNEEAALRVALNSLDDREIDHSHGSAEVLLQGAVGGLLRRGRLTQARGLIERVLPEQFALLEQPPAAFAIWQQSKHRPTDSWLVMASVFQAQGDRAALARALGWLDTIGLDTARQTRDQLLNEDFLTEAATALFRDQPQRAVSLLEQALDRGYRQHWHLMLRDGPVFARLHGEPVFQQALDDLERDLARQRAARQQTASAAPQSLASSDRDFR